MTKEKFRNMLNMFRIRNWCQLHNQVKREKAYLQAKKSDKSGLVEI